MGLHRRTRHSTYGVPANERGGGSTETNMRLTEQDRIDIRIRSMAGETQVSLAREYQVSRATIQNTIRGYYKTKEQPGQVDPKLWNKLAKANEQKISNRPDAIKYNEHRWNI